MHTSASIYIFTSVRCMFVTLFTEPSTVQLHPLRLYSLYKVTSVLSLYYVTNIIYVDSHIIKF